ncbi:HPr-rel-A system PqqD family peptide chaperone [Sphingomonas asaccharolytica]|uniref:HPr-rel-A system PqqD family peptide chaperone n=1 Tax=Sphingomonas asaccharolytica TaxID=40681 RepID=UPI00082F4152|nr:HPr-rel-A system PqqD family peptide chaperone [Sphingomonas asaccharolytica]
MATLYRAASSDSLIVAPIDVLTAIYHRASGQTHLMASPAPEILEALADAPLDAGALLAKLRVDYDLVDADPEALIARLDELVETGLVERR